MEISWKLQNDKHPGRATWNGLLMHIDVVKRPSQSLYLNLTDNL